MTTHIASPTIGADSQVTGTDVAAADRPTGIRALKIVAGLALASGPALWAAGMFTSPAASSTADVDYITSLGRDGTITQVSALLLHYGNLFIGMGVLAAATLLRRRKGSLLTVIGSVLAALGFTNVAGMLLSDWWNLSLAQNVPIDQAAKVFAGFKDSSLLALWEGGEVFALVGTILLLVGLARAGILAWWNLAIFVAGFVGLMFIPWDLPKLSALAVLVGFSPFAVIGARLVQRARLAA